MIRCFPQPSNIKFKVYQLYVYMKLRFVQDYSHRFVNFVLTNLFDHKIHITRTFTIAKRTILKMILTNTVKQYLHNILCL